MIIDRPCTSCGIPLEKGVKFVAIADIVLGFLGTFLWSILVHIERVNTNYDKSKSGGENTVGSTNSNHIYILLLTFSILQIILGYLLLAGRNKTSICYIWLLLSAFLILSNGFLIKIYQMIVVYSFTEELKGEAHVAALDEFRKLPYYCQMKTQVYPPPVYGLKMINKNGLMTGRKQSVCFIDRTFLVNSPSVFSIHDRHPPFV